jgi:hypothetical protein
MGGMGGVSDEMATPSLSSASAVDARSGNRSVPRLLCHIFARCDLLEIFAIPGLGCQADGGVGHSVAPVAAAFDDFEEKALGEGTRYQLEILAVVVDLFRDSTAQA